MDTQYDQHLVKHIVKNVLVKKNEEFYSLKFTHFNAQGLTSKFAEFTCFVNEHHFDVIAISETWLDESVADSEFTPDGYSCFRKDRSLNFYPEGTYSVQARGGVAILVSNSLNPTRNVELDTDAELIWVNIQPNDSTTALLGVAYRPDKGGLQCMSKICESLNKVHTSWGASAPTLRTSALALCYSVAEYCTRSPYTRLVDVQLNEAMRTVSGTLRPTPLPWLPVLSHIAPPHLRRKEATTKLLAKIRGNDSLPIHADIENHPDITASNMV